jgi:hypothetical protein
MNLIESLLMWAKSLEAWFSHQDVIINSGSSAEDVLRRSAWVNVRKGNQEAELILWESGEAEFGSSTPQTGNTDEHLDLRSVGELAPVLSRLLMAVE